MFLHQTWGLKSVIFYAEQMSQGRQLPKPFENVEDDPHQMGGDFVISGSGRFLLLHCSTNSTDRPSVDTILNVLSSG